MIRSILAKTCLNSSKLISIRCYNSSIFIRRDLNKYFLKPKISSIQPFQCIFIRVQETPNPYTLLFDPGEKILDGSGRTFEFTSASGANQSPLAVLLFQIDGVKSVYFGEDFIVITKKNESDWEVMKPRISEIISEYLQSGKAVITNIDELSSQSDDIATLDDDGSAKGMRFRMRVEARTSGTQGADRVVGIAFALNACDMICKFGAAYLTGSKSLFAEAIHSTMDTVNQLILFLGIRYSSRNPDLNFPYGYGNMRYVTSLISGCGILSFGCGLSMYHGISGLLHPSELEPMNYAYYALAMSFCFQGFSAITAFREVRKKSQEANMSMLQYVRSSADPSLNVVLLEDTAAVTGVFVALTAISLSSLLNSPIPDCVGSIVIGGLLGTVATFIIRTNASHLVGRSLPKSITDDIVCKLESDPVIRSVHDVKATSLGVEKSRFKAEIDFNGRAITQAYLNDNCNTEKMLEAVKSFEKPTEMEEFMLTHGERIIDRVGDEVDRIERQITKKHPDIRHVDLEAL